MATTPQAPDATPAPDLYARSVDRRSFLRYTGATAVVGGLLLAGCDNDDDDTGGSNQPSSPTLLNLANSDIGILNYAYALEQLEAAFYTRVADSSAFTGADLDRFKYIRDHEITHREFFKSVLGDGRLKDLTPKFDAIDFTSKMSILSTARTFEDLGVAAYNGAGNLIADMGYLTVAGKIVSVEARHAAYIREMIVKNAAASRMPMTGMGITVPAAVLTASGMDGFDMAMVPSQVLPLAAPFISDTLTSDLP